MTDSQPTAGEKPRSLRAAPFLHALLQTILLASPLAEAAADVEPKTRHEAPLYELEDQRDSTLVFDVGLGRTSRIAIADERIAALVADKTALSVKTDARTGEVYVIPLVEGDLTAYVSTAGGETIALLLRASSEHPPRNLVLRRRSAPQADDEARKDTRSALALAPLPSPDVEAAAKRVLKAMALDRPDDSLMRRHACPNPSPALAAALVKLAALTKPGSAASGASSASSSTRSIPNA